MENFLTMIYVLQTMENMDVIVFSKVNKKRDRFFPFRVCNIGIDPINNW